ncbi:MAG: hypothetical protein HDR14_13985 [Lachnospiraceae bacterium]|nr:hypothetical protein [Lachnospiraceae bacterium]
MNMEHGNMIAVAGTPGSGKTTISAKLAAEAAKSRKNVILVACDPFVPSLPFLLPMEAGQETSLGELLTAPALEQDKILKACVPIPESGYISLLGYKLGEGLMSYPKLTRDRVLEFLVCLRHLADYVILDTASVFEADLFSLLALEAADRILWVGTPNLRGISHYQTHEGMLAEARGTGKYVSAIGNFKTGQEWEAAAEQYGGVSFVFPYVAGLEKQYDEGTLFQTLSSKEVGVFQGEIVKAMRELFGIQPRTVSKGSGQGKKKLAIRSPFVWNSGKGEF